MKLRYWFKQGLNMTAFAAIAGGVYGLFSLLSGEEASWSNVLTLCAGYLMAMGALLCFLMAANTYQLHLPLVLSCGATRKEAFWGVQVARIAYTVMVAAVVAVLLALRPEKGGLETLAAFPLVAGVCLVCHAAGGLLAVVYTKFHKIGLAIGCVVLFVTLMAGIIAFVMAVDDGTMPDFTPGLAFGVLGVGAAVYLLEAPLEAKTISTYAVKL